ncbi:hypothetical protein J6500_02350, partial [Bradyrhizobium sp. WSM 1704]|uniref:beta strand repeat-containing protein n=1 Tax=Bradyrhizobium semiaridum TaxID=2821404 RepID=UPI001CE3B560
SVTAGSYTDVAGNLGSTGADTVAIDTQNPTVVVEIADASLSDGHNSSNVTFTFSEAVSAATVATLAGGAGITVAGGTLSALSWAADHTSATATFTATDGVTASGSVTVAAGGYTDVAGNLGSTGADTVAIDTQNPTVVVGISDTALKIGDVATVTFTFSEVPSNFSAADVTYDTTSATLGAITATANPLVFTASLTPIASITDATNIITVGTAWQDPAGNAPAASVNSVNYTVDTVAPTVAVNIVDTSLDNADPSSVVTFTFSEATSDFLLTDITAVGGTVSGLTGSGTTYQATFTATPGFTGTGSVSVTNGSYTDPAGNTGASGSDTVAISRPNDSTPPTLNSITATNLGNTQGATATVTFTFSEQVTNFDLTDVTIDQPTRISLSNLHVTADPLVWQATATRLAANGSYKLTVASNTFTDLAGNANTTSTTSGQLAPAGVAGSEINLALTDQADHIGATSVTVSGVPIGWMLSDGTSNGDGTWNIVTNDLSSLTITTPSNYTGALVLYVTESWTNIDGSIGQATIADNIEAFAAGNPIFAISGDDTLTGSSGHDTFVFSQPIGHDVLYSFEVSADVIDLISYGWQTFADVQAHTADDVRGNAVITLASGQTITLDGVHAADLTAANFEFDVTPTTENAGQMTIGDGAILPLSGIIDNTGSIELQASGDGTLLQLIQTGITLNGGGHVTLSDDDHNFIAGTTTTVTLDNVDNVISGAGWIGQGNLVLSNAGTIDATGTHALVIDTGASVIANTGTLEASGSGGLVLNSAVDNSGLIWANGGMVTAEGAVSGNGNALISGAGTIDFGASATANVTFDATAAGHLILDDAFHFSGTVSGFDGNDIIDIKGVSFGAGTTLNFLENEAGTGGTLTVSDGAHTANIVVLGQYDPTGFAGKADATNGVVITYDAYHLV